MTVQLKRAYDPPDGDDGARLLVERLWPRGLTKDALQLSAWLKEISPSPELRKWFCHDPEKWDEFQRRYLEELQSNPDALAELRGHLKGSKKVTFVYAAKDPAMNSALLLKQFLENKKI